MGSLIRLRLCSLITAALLALIPWLVGVARASPQVETCPGPDAFDALARQPNREAALRGLTSPALETACANASDYLWLRGLISRQLGDLTAASTWLEASLLRQPDRAGALLDFALTREAMGDLDSAEAIYRRLLAQYNPSERVRELIERRLQSVAFSLATRKPDDERLRAADAFREQALNQPSPATGAQWFGFVSIALGYDSNLNSASSLLSFNFTVDDQLIALEIPARDLPQAGRFQAINSRVERRVLLEDFAWGLTMRQSLRLPEDARFRTGAIEVATDAAYKLTEFGPLSGELSALLGKQWLGVENSLVARSDRIAIAFEPVSRIRLGPKGCSVQLGLEFERRRYPARQALDGNLSYQGLKLLCEANTGRVEIFGRRGRDESIDPTRAGGDQSKVDWGAAWIQKFIGHSVRLHWFVSESVDKKGYNSLIENNKIRNSRRSTAGLEWSTKSSRAGLEPFVSFERSDQEASIPIFAYNAWQFSVGLRWHF